ncbi:IS5/IS1182 family transposase (plasmid) [Leisingera sp. M527]|nr:IS5/IS1182 family transposase [Leisingera sp. M527]
MRGTDEAGGSLFSYVDLEARIPARHPLRKIRQVVNDALASLDADFQALYTDFGRPLIPPERLIRAILAHREVAPLLSDDHFSVDGTFIKAWASMKSFRPKAAGTPPGDDGPDDPPKTSIAPVAQPIRPETETDQMPRFNRRRRNPEVNFKGEKRSNATHASVTGPDARLYKKSPGTGAALCFMGHALMENRHGMVVQGDPTQADGRAERKTALDMLHRHSPGSTRQLTLDAAREYDAAEFVADLRQACVTPHVARKARHSAIDGRTTRHKGYAQSQKHRKRIEEVFGWARTVGGMSQTVYRGVEQCGRASS